MSTTTALARVLDALDTAGRKRKADGSGGYLVSCPGPSHRNGDRNPSLHVTEGASGSVLLQCFAGCETDAIVEALGLAMTDLFTDHERKAGTTLRPFEPTRKLSDAISPTPVARTVTTDYRYTDADGVSVGLVRRMDEYAADGSRVGKRFAQYRTEKGNDLPGLAGKRLPLYRLPEVLTAIAEGVSRVWLTEGEKCADALVGIGEVATTNAGGSGNWRDDLADSLTSAPHVVVVMDKDEQGRKWARNVSDSLTARGVSFSLWEASGDAHDIADAIRPGASTDDLVEPVEDLLTAGKEPPETPEIVASSWEPVDLSPYLDGTYTPESPALLHREDGQALLYRGRVHSFHGESESGKSWVALVEAARLLQAGEPVLFLDFEDTASGAVERLRALGVSRESFGLLTYLSPQAKPDAFDGSGSAFEELLARPYALAIIDGLTEALSLWGLDGRHEGEVAPWYRRVPKRIAKDTGAAVVIVDHVTKDRDGRGRMPLGTQHKMAAVDGAAFVVEPVEPLGRGLRGVICLRLGKDRRGGLRGKVGPYRKTDRTQEAARIVIDSTDFETSKSVRVTVEPPTSHVGEESAPFRPTGLMEKACRILTANGGAMSVGDLDAALGCRKANALEARNALISGGYVSAESGARGTKLLTLIRAYAQADDPQSDKYAPPLTLVGTDD